MSDYFDSVKRFASQTYNNVVQASSNAVAQVQQQQIPPIYVNGVMYQVLEKHGEVSILKKKNFFFFSSSSFFLLAHSFVVFVCARVGFRLCTK